jgi:hypothetical protein
MQVQVAAPEESPAVESLAGPVADREAKPSANVSIVVEKSACVCCQPWQCCCSLSANSQQQRNHALLKTNAHGMHFCTQTHDQKQIMYPRGICTCLSATSSASSVGESKKNDIWHIICPPIKQKQSTSNLTHAWVCNWSAVSRNGGQALHDL